MGYYESFCKLWFSYLFYVLYEFYIVDYRSIDISGIPSDGPMFDYNQKLVGLGFRLR